jgi:hypothetical protein
MAVFMPQKAEDKTSQHEVVDCPGLDIIQLNHLEAPNAQLARQRSKDAYTF